MSHLVFYDLFSKLLQVGTITLVSLTGFFVFMLFVLAATFNAIVISLLVSLAVAGGFLAFFFASVTAIYIGALSVSTFAISTATFWAIVAILITTGNKLFNHLNFFSSLIWHCELLLLGISWHLCLSK